MIIVVPLVDLGVAVGVEDFSKYSWHLDPVSRKWLRSIVCFAAIQSYGGSTWRKHLRTGSERPDQLHNYAESFSIDMRGCNNLVGN